MLARLTPTRMGSALITAVPADTVNYLMAAKHNGLPMGRMVSEVMKTFLADPHDRRELAARLGIAAHAGVEAAIGTHARSHLRESFCASAATSNEDDAPGLLVGAGSVGAEALAERRGDNASKLLAFGVDGIEDAIERRVPGERLVVRRFSDVK